MLANNAESGAAYGPPASAAAAAPSAGGGAYYAPPSGAVGAAEGYAGATNAYQRALIRFNQQRTGLLRQYGYAGDIDPTTGMLTNMRVDNTNVHGGLQSLLHDQANEDTQAEYGAEERGLHGGLANQAESELHYQHGGQTSSLAQALLGNLSDINSQQVDAKSTLDQALWQLQQQAAQSAVDNGDFNPANISPQATAAVQAAIKAASKKPAAKAAAKPVAKAITANKTGGTFVQGRGIISVH